MIEFLISEVGFAHVKKKRKILVNKPMYLCFRYFILKDGQRPARGPTWCDS